MNSKERRDSEIEGRPIIAIFDIDKTVVPGFTILDFADFLAANHQFDGKKAEELHKLLADYSAGKMKYDPFADAVVDTYAKGIAGQSEAEVTKLSYDFWRDRFAKIFPYVVKNLANLKSKQAHLIALSGSSKESLLPLFERLGFAADSVATEMEVVDGRYTGNVKLNAASLPQKEKIIETLFSRLPLHAYTFGFGDSGPDFAFLDRVDTAVMIGKNPELLEKSKGKDWLHIEEPTIDMPIVA